jgi:hypothetical protein
VQTPPEDRICTTLLLWQRPTDTHLLADIHCMNEEIYDWLDRHENHCCPAVPSTPLPRFYDRFRGHNGHRRACRRFEPVVNDPKRSLTRSGLTH